MSKESEFVEELKRSCDKLMEAIEDYHDAVLRKPQFSDFQKERLK